MLLDRGSIATGIADEDHLVNPHVERRAPPIPFTHKQAQVASHMRAVSSASGGNTGGRSASAPNGTGTMGGLGVIGGIRSSGTPECRATIAATRLAQLRP